MTDSTVPVAQPGQGARASSDVADQVGDLADGLIRDFHPVTALDVGRDQRPLVAALRERGVDATGIEAPERIEGRYDLVTCLDALDDRTKEETDAVLASLCAATDTLVVAGSAPPDLAARLSERGFLHRLDRDLSYLSASAAAFERDEESRADAVRRYERALWQLRGEVAEVRRALAEQRQRLAELEAGGETGAEAEILRLRDLLIGKEAELGVAVGRVAEHDARGSWKALLKDRWYRFRGAVAELPGARRLKRLIRSR